MSPVNGSNDADGHDNAVSFTLRRF